MTTSPGVNVTITDLPAATLPLLGTEILEMVQYPDGVGGSPQSVKITVDDLLGALAARVAVLEGAP